MNDQSVSMRWWNSRSDLLGGSLLLFISILICDWIGRRRLLGGTNLSYCPYYLCSMTVRLEEWRTFNDGGITEFEGQKKSLQAMEYLALTKNGGR